MFFPFVSSAVIYSVTLPYVLRFLDVLNMFKRSRSAPLLGSDRVPSTGKRETVDIREDWLNEVCPLLNKYDAKMLRRYIAFLPIHALAKVWSISHYEYLRYLADRRENGEEEQVSKMAMRKVLESTFETVSRADDTWLAVYKHWQATKDKSNRKSKSTAGRYEDQRKASKS